MTGSWFTEFLYLGWDLLRRMVLPRSVKHWSLTTTREKLIKIGAKVDAAQQHHGVTVPQAFSAWKGTLE